MKPFTAAVVQASSVLFDRQACLEQVAEWTAKAREQGAALVLFPEAFIPGYPRGLSFGSRVGSRSERGRRAWQHYWENALSEDSSAAEALSGIARDNEVYLIIGLIEQGLPAGTLYCSLFYYGPEGQLLHKHRKLKPTAAERIIWGEGDGSDLQVISTELGKIGGLICWENYMPLARTALYEQGVEIYLAPTADQRDSWQASMQHIACEGRCYVLSCNQYITRSMYPKEFREEVSDQPELMCRGGSVIISPLGEVLAGPLWDEEGMLLADIDPGAIIRGKLDFDPVGHYHRPVVFSFRWKGDP
ncbi:MAG: carbon-nitrogen hydrolase family protein [Saprospiraceae bacterium]|nr:carbon-nitrogen hydrolase family protein [Saprospiraceae bacterium]